MSQLCNTFSEGTISVLSKWLIKIHVLIHNIWKGFAQLIDRCQLRSLAFLYRSHKGTQCYLCILTSKMIWPCHIQLLLKIWNVMPSMPLQSLPVSSNMIWHISLLQRIVIYIVGVHTIRYFCWLTSCLNLTGVIMLPKIPDIFAAKTLPDSLIA